MDGIVKSEGTFFQQDKSPIDQDSGAYLTVSVQSKPQISITAPTGGAIWNTSETKNIQWSNRGSVGDNVKIQLSRNGGSSWSNITSNTFNDGTHPWTVSGPVSDICKIKIISNNDPNIFGESGSFSIKDPCNDHDLKISQYGLSNTSMKFTGFIDTTTYISNVRNLA